ncbi:MAG: DUF2203 family protein [Deltaproteobacteria bacterium]|nr:MAG: DUF2203 family protein [Deltaproteobacteria bacterium]
MSDEPDFESGHDDERPGRRLYTVGEANALIPHLLRCFAQLDEGRAEMQELVDVLTPLGVKIGHVVPPSVAADPRVRPHLESLMQLNEQLQLMLNELAELGVEVKGLDGLVDVRSRHEGRIVYLCWRRGESEFSHWHELEAGFAGRAPIVDPEGFEGTLLI